MISVQNLVEVLYFCLILSFLIRKQSGLRASFIFALYYSFYKRLGYNLAKYLQSLILKIFRFISKLKVKSMSKVSKLPYVKIKVYEYSFI